jgi:N-acetylglutamate synthase-like GNAT family acetyltransferase
VTAQEAPGPGAGEGAVEVRRVGPGGSMAPDSAFAVALLTLWHGVARAGGAAGFLPSVDRSELGDPVSRVIADLRSGRAYGYALTRKRAVIGFAMLEPGTGVSAHTGTISLVMVEPNSQAAGLGTTLMRSILELAKASDLERIRLFVAADQRLQRFFGQFGFAESGRSPRWIRTEAEPDVDQVLMTSTLDPPR